MKSGIWIALAAALGLTVLWDSQMILPFKLLVVLLHEMWHGLASLVFGARVERIILHPGETGETLVTGLRGGWGVAMSVSAGYLGSALTGAVLLRRGLLESFERTALLVFAGLTLYMTSLYCAPGSLAFTTGIGWSLGLLFACALGERYARMAILIVGTMFLWYSFFDLFDFTRDVKRTDAGILARFLKSKSDISVTVTGLSAVISVLWTGAMLVMLYYLLGTIIIQYASQAPVESGTAPGPGAPPGGPLADPLADPNTAAQTGSLTGPPSGPLTDSSQSMQAQGPQPQGPPSPAAGSALPVTPVTQPAMRNDMADLLALRDQLRQR